MAERKANAEWNGTLKEGAGKIALRLGATTGRFAPY